MSEVTFTQHYVDYIRSPAVILLLTCLVAPLLRHLVNKTLEQRRPRRSPLYGCFRLGIKKNTNLPDQQKSAPGDDATPKDPQIKALFTYPVKSCRGIELAASEVVPTGLKYDRLFTFAQLVSRPRNAEKLQEGKAAEVSKVWEHEWKFITQREFPRLALIETELWVPDPRRKRQKQGPTESSSSQQRGRRPKAAHSPKSESRTSGSQKLQAARAELDDLWSSNGGCLIIRFPFEPDFNPFGIRTETVTIRLPLAPTSQRAAMRKYKQESLSIWIDQATAINVTNEISKKDLAKLKYVLGVSNPLALFRLDERNLRRVTRSLPEDHDGKRYSVGFGDAFPLHMLSLSSIKALKSGAPSASLGKQDVFDARRFRANIYIDGVPAYEEDRWKKILIGRCLKVSSNGRKLLEADGEYHVACRTARCTMPNVDQDTGVKDKNEPYTTLGKTRKVDPGAYPYPCLGMQMIPLFPQGLLKVGDEIHVAETGEHYYEKMFS